MPADGAPSPTQASLRPKDARGSPLSGILLRRIWLPTGLYQALPWAYLLLGAGCLASALLLPGSEWLLPYVILLGLACVHAGCAVAGIRRRASRARENAPVDRRLFCPAATAERMPSQPVKATGEPD